ncbi:MAG: beta-lactamase family protein [Candidatus Marinimicrobia bacterium]|jgi:CubicO group peptidase (beta-lactamase class C family)|nr:beta-lactamase family protein [Candidatus Neomarinimicrobiota bacterium]MBT3936342.1 beta-lactamase family protein [Candidatus Neomarinimicrobiota bacterium]MBT3960294.1 beta-lactamase family protein [Candidatus Neomarinimicrobiota bacterium]MBT4383382.1 beta-lactamase family protein [Candidatus Neomarinimicrobiota bacterium]MBT4635395.1 beta-lactamase family protein [Candidatus Neomarinimicrobiota bacterium]
MKFFTPIIVYILLGLSLTSCDNRTFELNQIAVDSTKIDSLMAPYNDGFVPGASLLIVQNGTILYAKGYGLAKLDNPALVVPETNFRLASISKQFTAACIMLLKSDGYLNYDQVLTNFFPDFPDYGQYITIRHLLHHTSGLKDYFSLIPDNVSEQVHDNDVLQLMMEQTGTYFTPGTQYQYSNSGYAILAMIVEAVSGQSYANFIYEYIFSPLGMDETIAFEDGISIIHNRAYGYNILGEEFVLGDQSITSAVLGDGGIYSSINDMFKWDQVLYTNILLHQNDILEAMTSGTLTNGNKTGYGFGWVIDEYRNRHRVGHTGSTQGFRNVYHRYPEESLSIVILTNRNFGIPKLIANEVADILFNAKTL